MLGNDSQQFVKTAFSNESEIEGVVQRNAERLFDSSIIYLPQTKISTLGGKNTVPDAIVIDRFSAPNKTAARVGEEAVWFRGGSEP
jgi:hypothetical protein